LAGSLVVARVSLLVALEVDALSGESLGFHLHEGLPLRHGKMDSAIERVEDCHVLEAIID